jgi:DNA-binding transcriptional ArsR family regulator
MTAASAPSIAPVAALLADRSRARMVSALADGRALPASVLAQESGVSASTASEHLGRLVAGGLLHVERSGRHRYYRLAGADVAAAVEALSVIAPQPPISSLRQSTRAAALRRARTCYDHVAGRLGVEVTASLLERGALVRVDGGSGLDRAAGDRLSAPARQCPFRLGPAADAVLGTLGVELAPLLDRPAGARPLLRCCLDWSEQRYHLAGALGAAVLERLLAAGWIRRAGPPRALELTSAGRDELGTLLGVADYRAAS